MQTFAYEYPSYYEIIVTDGTNQNSYAFSFNKEQNLNDSITVAQQLFIQYMNEKKIVPISV